MCECKGVFETSLYLAVIGEKGFEGLVDFDGLPSEADVEGGEAAQVLEVAEFACCIQVQRFLGCVFVF